MDDTTARVAVMVDGLDSDSPVADSFNLRLLEEAQAAGVPVFMYVAPFSPAAHSPAPRQAFAFWMPRETSSSMTRRKRPSFRPRH